MNTIDILKNRTLKALFAFVMWVMSFSAIGMIDTPMGNSVFSSFGSQFGTFIKDHKTAGLCLAGAVCVGAFSYCAYRSMWTQIQMQNDLIQIQNDLVRTQSEIIKGVNNNNILFTQCDVTQAQTGVIMDQQKQLSDLLDLKATVASFAEQKNREAALITDMSSRLDLLSSRISTLNKQVDESVNDLEGKNTRAMVIHTDDPSNHKDSIVQYHKQDAHTPMTQNNSTNFFNWLPNEILVTMIPNCPNIVCYLGNSESTYSFATTDKKKWALISDLCCSRTGLDFLINNRLISANSLEKTHSYQHVNKKFRDICQESIHTNEQKNEQLTELDLLLKQYPRIADPNSCIRLKRRNAHCSWPLMIAIQKYNIPLITFLIERGANIENVIHVINEESYDADKDDSNQYTAIIQCLLQHNAKILWHDFLWTAITYYFFNRRYSLEKIRGVIAAFTDNINECDERGNTMLMHFTNSSSCWYPAEKEQRSQTVIRLLLDGKADVSIRRPDGKTVFDLCPDRLLRDILEKEINERGVSTNRDTTENT